MLGLGRCRHGMSQQHVFGFLHAFQLCGLLLQLDLHGGFRRCMSNALRAADNDSARITSTAITRAA